MNRKIYLSCCSLAVTGMLLGSCGEAGSGVKMGRSGSNVSSAAVPPPAPPPAPAAKADAGPDLTITLPTTRVRLAGVAQGEKLLWEQVSGPANASVQSTQQADTQVIATTPGDYVFRLTRSNANGTGVTTDTMTLTVNPNPISIGASSTPLDHLRSVNRPAIKTGHTLLPLTYSSCAVNSQIQIELMRHWGFAAQFNTGSNVTNNPVIDALKEKPGSFPVALSQASLHQIFNNYQGANTRVLQPPPETYIRNAAGAIILDGGKPIVSPIAPDSLFTQIGQQIGDTAREIEAATGQRINIVVNEGEYGLWLSGEKSPATLWGQDPAVMAAFNASGFSSWHAYISFQKARQERLLKEGIFSRLTLGRPFYSWYLEAYGPERGRWFGWRNYMFIWEQFISPSGVPQVSDFSSPQMYYNFFNSGWSGIQTQQGIPWDALTQALRDVGGAISLGQKYIYPWVSLGWDGGDSGGISDDDLYLGMMKAYFTAGAIGAASGYFTCAGPAFDGMMRNGVVGAQRPTQIRGFIQLARAYALFTHLEPFLKDGDLLPGPMNHPYSAATSGQTKAMEFQAVGETLQVPYGNRTVSIPAARVLARKMRNEDKWLVTTWASTGIDRPIKVTIDAKLGELTLEARRAGSVYIVELVDGKPKITQMDPNAEDPTATLFQ